MGAQLAREEFAGVTDQETLGDPWEAGCSPKWTPRRIDRLSFRIWRLVCGTIDSMEHNAGEFELTLDELRAVASFAHGCAVQSLPVFEAHTPHDRRPRDAVDAAAAFVNGAPRSKRQRVAALEAHRAAHEATREDARLAARAAGDAAAAAYLHPIAQSTQVGQILRAAACTARVIELTAPDDPLAVDIWVESLCRTASPVVREVLSRYPAAPPGRTRVARLMNELDLRLRVPHT